MLKHHCLDHVEYKRIKLPQIENKCVKQQQKDKTAIIFQTKIKSIVLCILGSMHEMSWDISTKGS